MERLDLPTLVRQEISECLKINGFSSIKIHFEFTFAVDQLVIYKQSDDLNALGSETQTQSPPIYKFTELVLHNMGAEILTVQPLSLIGCLEIHSLQRKFSYLPISVHL